MVKPNHKAMGAHVNYHSVIRHLVNLKGELYRMTKEKYQDLINELSMYEYHPYSEDNNLPDHVVLATKLQMKQSKMNSLLKTLHNELVREMIDPPLVIKEVRHQIHISLPYYETQGMNKEKKEKEWDESTWVDVVLPVSPSIGDIIEIPFIEQTGMNHRGYVHSKSHRITGKVQEVYLEVHPFHDYYHKWMKMKEDFEDWERWEIRWKIEQEELAHKTKHS